MKPNLKKKWCLGLAYAFILLGSLSQKVYVSGRTTLPIPTAGQSVRSKAYAPGRLAHGDLDREDNSKRRQSSPELLSVGEPLVGNYRDLSTAGQPRLAPARPVR